MGHLVQYLKSLRKKEQKSLAQAAITKYPVLGGFNNEYVCSHSSEAGGPRSGCRPAWVWWGLSFWSAEGHLLAVSLTLLIGTHLFLSPKSEDRLPPIFKYHCPSS